MSIVFLVLSFDVLRFSTGIAELEDCATQSGCPVSIVSGPHTPEEDEELSLLQMPSQGQMQNPQPRQTYGARGGELSKATRSNHDLLPGLGADSGSVGNSSGLGGASALGPYGDDFVFKGLDLGKYRSHESFATAYTNPDNNQDLLLDVTYLVGYQCPQDLDMSRKGCHHRPQVLISAQVAQGTWVGNSNVKALHYPLEDTANTIFEFRLASDNATVEVLQPQMTQRTSDSQSAEALKEGVDTPWVMSLPVVKTSGPKHSVVVDATGFISHGFGVAASTMGSISNYHVNRVEPFAQNFDVLLEVLGGSLLSTHQLITFSLILLPEKPMVPRIFDDRAPYFSVDYTDRGVHKSNVDKSTGFTPKELVDTDVSVIYRYNLAELPQHQIRWYVDPTVPKRWREAFREGIEAWNAAFTLAGWTKAVRAFLPEDADWPSDYNAGDVRFNTISWAIQDAVQSIGVAKVDPRSGEILKSDVIMSDGWVSSYLNDLNLQTPEVTHHPLRGFYRENHDVSNVKGLASLLGQPPGRLSMANLTNLAWEKIMNTGLRHIVMHETGHGLGLRHNFKGSLGVSYECTQDIECSAVKGLSASVMDYVPMNVPSTGIDNVHVFSPVLGEFDKLAIQYGYTDAPSEKNQVVPSVAPELTDILHSAEQFQVCVDGDYQTGADPFCEAYDFTASPLRYYADQLVLIANLQQNLLNLSVAPGHSYWRYGDAVQNLWAKVDTIATKLRYWVGGVNSSYGHRGVDGTNAGHDTVRPVPVALLPEFQDLVVKILHPRTSGLLPPLENQAFLTRRLSLSFNGVGTIDVERLAEATRKNLVSALLGSQALMHVDMLAGLGGESVYSFLKGTALTVFSLRDQDLTTSAEQDWDLQELVAKTLGQLYHNDTILPEHLLVQLAMTMDNTREDIKTSLLNIGVSDTMKELTSDTVDQGLGLEARRVHLHRLDSHLVRKDRLFKSGSTLRAGPWPLIVACCVLIGVADVGKRLTF